MMQLPIELLALITSQMGWRGDRNLGRVCTTLYRARHRANADSSRAVIRDFQTRLVPLVSTWLRFGVVGDIRRLELSIESTLSCAQLQPEAMAMLAHLTALRELRTPPCLWLRSNIVSYIQLTALRELHTPPPSYTRNWFNVASFTHLTLLESVDATVYHVCSNDVKLADHCVGSSVLPWPTLRRFHSNHSQLADLWTGLYRATRLEELWLARGPFSHTTLPVSLTHLSVELHDDDAASCERLMHVLRTLTQLDKLYFTIVPRVSVNDASKTFSALRQLTNLHNVYTRSTELIPYLPTSLRSLETIALPDAVLSLPQLTSLSVEQNIDTPATLLLVMATSLRQLTVSDLDDDDDDDLVIQTFWASSTRRGKRPCPTFTYNVVFRYYFWCLDKDGFDRMHVQVAVLSGDDGDPPRFYAVLQRCIDGEHHHYYQLSSPDDEFPPLVADTDSFDDTPMGQVLSALRVREIGLRTL
jgi:hypothetical protein